MENKGLCGTCVSDAKCALHRKYPIVECSEFSVIELALKEEENQRQEE